jgi:hypothetical protein
MNLVLLAPDIQEEILFLPVTERGRDPIHFRQLQGISVVQSWQKQRILWQPRLVIFRSAESISSSRA